MQEDDCVEKPEETAISSQAIAQEGSGLRHLRVAIYVLLPVTVIVLVLCGYSLYLETRVFQPIGAITKDAAVLAKHKMVFVAFPLLLLIMAGLIAIPISLIRSILLLPSRIRKGVIIALAIAAVFGIVAKFLTSEYSMLAALPLLLLTTVSIIAVPVLLAAPIALLFNALLLKSGSRGIGITLTIAAAFGIVVTGIAVERSIYLKQFHHVFSQLADRSQPLIDAIENYKEAKGVYPLDLQGLVPEFLPEIPKTGLAGYPDYEYRLPGPTEDGSNIGPYELLVNTPSGGLNWDVFVYWPSGEYPDYFYGGNPEIFGRWAYVHE